MDFTSEEKVGIKLMGEGNVFKLIKPAGDSKDGWCTTHCRTWRAVTCEVCGTDFPELDEEAGEYGYELNTIFGKQVVDRCCGKLLDMLFDELREDFFHKSIEEFKSDPLGSDASLVRIILQGAMKSWKDELIDRSKELQETCEDVGDLVRLTAEVERKK